MTAMTLLAIEGGGTNLILGLLLLCVIPAIPALMSKRAEPSSRGGSNRPPLPDDGLDGTRVEP